MEHGWRGFHGSTRIRNPILIRVNPRKFASFVLEMHRLLVDAAVGGVDDAEHLLDGLLRLVLRVDDAVIELYRALHLLPGGGRAQGHALGRVLLALPQAAHQPLLGTRGQEDGCLLYTSRCV